MGHAKRCFEIFRPFKKGYILRKSNSSDTKVISICKDTLKELEEERLLQEYLDSPEYEEKSLREAENQMYGEAEQNNHKAISHPDYPEDFS